jgi:hypothetical protein
MDVFGESTWMYSRRVCVDRYMLFKLPGELQINIYISQFSLKFAQT